MENFLDIAKRAVQSQERTLPYTLEEVVSGLAIELWSDAAGRFFIVADELDVEHLRVRDPSIARGEIYTAREIRRIVKITDATIVAEIHEWKRLFDGVVSK